MKVFHVSAGTSKYDHLKLEQVGDEVDLVAVDSGGQKPSSGSIILTIRHNKVYIQPGLHADVPLERVVSNNKIKIY